MTAITGFKGGNDFEIRRTIADIPTDQTITKGWLTIKASFADDDPGVLQKIITTADVPGTGQITDDGETDETGEVRFDLSPDDTLLLVPTRSVPVYYYDIQVLTSAGKLYTAESDTIVAGERVTQAVE